jgi:hypothetical protein
MNTQRTPVNGYFYRGFGHITSKYVSPKNFTKIPGVFDNVCVESSVAVVLKYIYMVAVALVVLLWYSASCPSLPSVLMRFPCLFSPGEAYFRLLSVSFFRLSLLFITMVVVQSVPLVESAEDDDLEDDDLEDDDLEDEDLPLPRPPKRAKSNRAAHRKQKRRAGANGKSASVVGIEHRIYMMMKDPADNKAGYITHSGTAKKYPDSFVHRFGRTVGFKDKNSPTEAVLDELQLHARRRSNMVQGKLRSLRSRTYAQSCFECYCLAVHPTAQYTLYLQTIMSCDASYADQIECQQPEAVLLECYMWHLHDDPNSPDPTAPTINPPGRLQKASSIEQALKYLSSTTKEFGAGLLVRSEKMQTLLADWGEDEDVAAANAFDVEDDLPRLWDHLWTMPGPHYKKVSLWSRFLVQLAVIGRASDVCEEYCPKMCNIKFPSNPDDWYDDGTPVFIQLIWTDWKARPRKQRRSPYSIRLFSNPLDMRFCPVHWLMEFWELHDHRRENGLEKLGDIDDPILANIVHTTYKLHCKALFDGVQLDCTPHSIRRTGAQWASQCGINLQVIRDVGRWTDIKNMFIYVAEGRQKHNKKRAESSTSEDGVFNIWVFNAKTADSSMPMSAEMLYSLAPAHLQLTLA